eukprot:8125124-Prorocentrum_lima.AAC.1
MAALVNLAQKDSCSICKDEAQNHSTLKPGGFHPKIKITRRLHNQWSGQGHSQQWHVGWDP